MRTLKVGMKGDDVKTLQKALAITPVDGIYGEQSAAKVKEFQKSKGLVADGVVGPKTWVLILNSVETQTNTNISSNNDMYDDCAKMIGCEVAALKAVKQVETGGKSAFIAPHKPAILFEGHVFWYQLQSRGIDPLKYQPTNKDILYRKWTCKYYKSGLAEYTRLEKARKINTDAANASTSWGMFQILGCNYKMCGCSSVTEFVDKMCTSEKDQLMLTTKFIMNNKNIRNALISKDWTKFAYYYNGSGYKKNKYDTKLQAAYNKLKNS